MNIATIRSFFGISLTVSFVILLSYFFVYPKIRLAYYEIKAKPTINHVEQFRKKNGRYPESLSEAGMIPEQEWLEYERTDGSYRLSFYAGAYWYVNTYNPEKGEWYIRD